MKLAYGLLILSALGLSQGCSTLTETHELTPEELQKLKLSKSDIKTDTTPLKPQASTCIEAAKSYELLAKGATEEQMKTGYAWKARQAFQQALSIETNNIEAALGIARMTEMSGDVLQARVAYENTLKLCAGNKQAEAVVCHQLGMFCGRTKDWNGSITYLQKAVEIDNMNQTYVMDLGWCFARNGRFDESFGQFRRVVGDSQAYYRLAQMTKHLGQTEQSKQFATAALQSNPNSKDAQDLLASLNADVNTQQNQVQQAGFNQ